MRSTSTCRSSNEDDWEFPRIGGKPSTSSPIGMSCAPPQMISMAAANQACKACAQEAGIHATVCVRRGRLFACNTRRSSRCDAALMDASGIACDKYGSECAIPMCCRRRTMHRATEYGCICDRPNPGGLTHGIFIASARRRTARIRLPREHAYIPHQTKVLSRDT